MRSDHSIQQDLDFFFKKFPAIADQGIYAVAVSGGPDSMALAHLICHALPMQNKEIHILTVDHGLRVQSKKEAQDVKKWVQTLSLKNVIHATLNWEGDKPETSIMESARQARYDLMAQYCLKHKIETIFVAHHQDDQAETFLIRLAKGSGFYGLAGMSEIQQYSDKLNIVRPLLGVPKNNLIKYCQINKLKYVVDSSNENINYLRPRLRQSMEILEKEGLTSKRLAVLSHRMGRARQALEKFSGECYNNCLIKEDENSILLDFKKLLNQPEEIIFRVVQMSVKNLRDTQDYDVRMERLENLVEYLAYNTESFKPRTLGGLIFALKDKNSALYIKREKE